MEIIFVRHAIAEARREDLDDLDRHLTQKGIDKFSESLPKLFNKIKADEDLIVWMSPANRAKETAEIVLQELTNAKVDTHDFIYSGEFEGFKQAISQIDSQAKVLIFGHEPTLTIWVKELTGQLIKMKKGAIVSLNMEDISSFKATINWKIKP